MERKDEHKSAEASDAITQAEILSEKAQDTFANAGTLDAMIQAKRDRLTRTPDEERVLWSLGELLRMQGSLDEALDCYRGVLRANPGHPGARKLAAILGQETLPECSSEVHASPFVQDEAFLTEAEQDAVWGALRDGMAESRQSAVGKGKKKGGVDTDVRSSHVLYAPQLKPISGWFRKRVASSLKHLWERIGVEPFSIGTHELQLTIHRRGDFFRLHRDSGPEKTPTGNRRVTFVYYFHRQPKQFSGGDLLLYDTDLERHKSLGKYTRIEPRNNSILFFPSPCFHRVMPVDLKSEEVEDGRLTLNGWIHPVQKKSDKKSRDAAADQ